MWSGRFGFDVPDDFPLRALEAIHARVSDGPHSIKEQNELVWREWAGGCNGALYRFASATRASDAWAESSAVSISPPMPERLEQEHQLFVFFASALSALECLTYGLCAIGEFLRPAVFQVTTNPRAVTFAFAAKTLSAEFPRESLGATLTVVKDSDEMKALGETRNILAHRIAAGRHFGAIEVWLGGTLGPETTTSPRDWVARTLGEILDEADGFTQRLIV